MTTKGIINYADAEERPIIAIEARGGLDQPTLDAIHHLARSQGRNCDAIGECGYRCTLRAGHPGDIHEAGYGLQYRFRLTGDAWRW